MLGPDDLKVMVKAARERAAALWWNEHTGFRQYPNDNLLWSEGIRAALQAVGIRVKDDTVG